MVLTHLILSTHPHSASLKKGVFILDLQSRKSETLEWLLKPTKHRARALHKEIDEVTKSGTENNPFNFVPSFFHLVRDRKIVAVSPKTRPNPERSTRILEIYSPPKFGPGFVKASQRYKHFCVSQKNPARL